MTKAARRRRRRCQWNRGRFRFRFNYLFGACSALEVILVDADWTLLKSGLSGAATFYNCKSIVGGNGTTYDSSKYSYTMMRVDVPGTAGYLTADA